MQKNIYLGIKTGLKSLLFIVIGIIFYTITPARADYKVTIEWLPGAGDTIYYCPYAVNGVKVNGYDIVTGRCFASTLSSPADELMNRYLFDAQWTGWRPFVIYNTDPVANIPVSTGKTCPPGWISIYNHYYQPLPDLGKDKVIWSAECVRDLGSAITLAEGKAKGVCGTALHNPAYYNKPTDNLCLEGTSSLVSGNGPRTWTCSGYSEAVTCQTQSVGNESKELIYPDAPPAGGNDGVCAIQATQGYRSVICNSTPEGCGSPVSYNFATKTRSGEPCRAGEPTTPYYWPIVPGVQGSNGAYYQCIGKNGGYLSPMCSSPYTNPPIETPECGSTVRTCQKGVLTDNVPSSLLADEVRWQCATKYTSITCSNKTAEELNICGTKAYTCNTGTFSGTLTDTTYGLPRWECTLPVNNNPYICIGTEQQILLSNQTGGATVGGVTCGTDNSKTLSSRPVSLCKNGIVENLVENTSSWMWTCSKNTTTVSCSAKKGASTTTTTSTGATNSTGTQTTASCGSDGGRILSTAPKNFCTLGTATNVVYNEMMGSWSWSCSTGTSVVSCGAIKNPIVNIISTGTNQVEVGRFTQNPRLQAEKVCYTPNESIQIIVGEKTIDKKLAVYQAVLAAYDLTKYTNTDEYMPNRTLKRNEAAKILVNYAKNVLCREKTATYKEGMYSDIAGTDETLIPYVKEAYEYGILKGGKGVFRPNANMTRIEFVVALVRLITNQYLPETNSPTTWADSYEKALSSMGYGNIIAKGEELTRGKVAELLYDVYNNDTYAYTDKGYIVPYK